MAIHVLHPGMLTTVQDLGRYRYAHLGISPAGAADTLSFRIANLLVGNAENTPALEMTLLGATLRFDSPAIIAIVGAECSLELDGVLVPHATTHHLRAGSTLKCGPMTTGARTYIAVQGGIDVPLVMDSASTFLPAPFGGYEGRRLQKGDMLKIGTQIASRPRTLRTRPAAGATLRVTRGPQQDWFSSDALATMLSTPFTVSDQSGRTGLRLSGERIVPRHTGELLTDGIPLGAVQIPADGQPIILFVDQQTTGGYPKIANVIAADLHRVGQLRPRNTVRFTEVSIDEALQLLLEQELWLKENLA
jgi:antagonist of KipI